MEVPHAASNIERLHIRDIAKMAGAQVKYVAGFTGRIHGRTNQHLQKRKNSLPTESRLYEAHCCCSAMRPHASLPVRGRFERG